MDEKPGLSDQYRMSSPWPILIAFGFAISEIGIFWPLAPLAVGGLLLFVGSTVGIIREVGYIESPWPLLTGIGFVLLVSGFTIFVNSGGTITMNSVAVSTRSSGSIGLRGISIAIAGGLALVGALVGKHRTSPTFEGSG